MQRAYWSLGETKLSPLSRKRCNVSFNLCLIKHYEKYQRRPSSKFEAEMSNIFGITKSDGEWLCEEDQKLYQNQVKFSGSNGYITNKKAPLSTIHPLKRNFFKKPFSESCEPSTTMIVEAPEYDSSDG